MLSLSASFLPRMLLLLLLSCLRLRLDSLADPDSRGLLETDSQSFARESRSPRLPLIMQTPGVASLSPSLLSSGNLTRLSSRSFLSCFDCLSRFHCPSSFLVLSSSLSVSLSPFFVVSCLSPSQQLRLLPRGTTRTL